MLENAICLYSLHRTISSSKVSPALEEPYKKTLQKRTSSVVSLIRGLPSKTSQERSGTALFIAATLLQRELVETMVPLQFLGIISILYYADVRSNSVTSNWSGVHDYTQTLMYTCIDLAVELLVFALTVVALKRVFPELSAWRILRGLVKVHWITMFQQTIGV